MSLVPYPMSISFTSPEDINRALQVEGVSQRVDENIKNYRYINISKTINKLSSAGKALHLTYACSNNHPCSKNILKIISSFQDLVKDSVSASYDFVQTSLSALRLHKTAIKLAESGSLEVAFRLLSKCAKEAKKMQKISQKMVNKAQALCAKAQSAFEQAESDKDLTLKEQEKIKKTLTKLKAEEAMFEKKSQDFEKVIEEHRKKEAEAMKNANDARKKTFICSVISACMKPVSMIGGAALGGPALGGIILLNTVAEKFGASNRIGNIDSLLKEISKETTEGKTAIDQLEQKLANKQEELKNANEEVQKKLKEEIEKLESEIAEKKRALQEQKNAVQKIGDGFKQESQVFTEHAAEVAKRIYEMQQDQIEANAQLAKSISKLKNIDLQQNELSKALESLNVTIKALCNIKTTFANTSVFWLQVKKHCKKLADTEIYKEYVNGYEEVNGENTVLKEIFLDDIKGSGLSWLALGKINYLAYDALSNRIDKEVDAIMCNLPIGEQAPSVIGELTGLLLKNIEEDNEDLKNNSIFKISELN